MSTIRGDIANLLVAVGAAHRAGVIHGAVPPEQVPPFAMPA